MRIVHGDAKWDCQKSILTFENRCCADDSYTRDNTQKEINCGFFLLPMMGHAGKKKNQCTRCVIVTDFYLSLIVEKSTLRTASVLNSGRPRLWSYCSDVTPLIYPDHHVIWLDLENSYIRPLFRVFATTLRLQV